MAERHSKPLEPTRRAAAASQTASRSPDARVSKAWINRSTRMAAQREQIGRLFGAKPVAGKTIQRTGEDKLRKSIGDNFDWDEEEDHLEPTGMMEDRTPPERLGPQVDAQEDSVDGTEDERAAERARVREAEADRLAKVGKLNPHGMSRMKPLGPLERIRGFRAMRAKAKEIKKKSRETEIQNVLAAFKEDNPDLGSK